MKYQILLLMLLTFLGCSVLQSKPKMTYSITLNERSYKLADGMSKADVMAIVGRKLRCLEPKAPGCLLETYDVSYRLFFEYDRLYSVIKQPGLRCIFESGQSCQ